MTVKTAPKPQAKKPAKKQLAPATTPSAMVTALTKRQIALLIQTSIALYTDFKKNTEALAENVYALSMIEDDGAALDTLKEGTQLTDKFVSTLLLLAKGEIIPELVWDNSYPAERMRAFSKTKQEMYYRNKKRVEVLVLRDGHPDTHRMLSIWNMGREQLRMTLDSKADGMRSLVKQKQWVESQRLAAALKKENAIVTSYGVSVHGLEVNCKCIITLTEMERLIKIMRRNNNK